MAAPAAQATASPPPGHPTWGKGGDYDCGSNAVYAQGESPPPPDAQQGEGASSAPVDAAPGSSDTYESLVRRKYAALTGVSARPPASPETRSSSTPAGAGSGGSALPSALAGGAAGPPALPEGTSSTPAAAAPGGRVSFAASAEEMAGRPALLKGARGASGDGNWFGGTGGDGAGGAEPAGAMESDAAGEPGASGAARSGASGMGASLSPMSPLY